MDDDEPSSDWRLSSPGDDEAFAGLARRTLLELSPLRPANASTPYDHLNTWVAALERVGVLVMATSRGQVLPQEMRAFSLYFDHLPVIMVNGADSARGRLFSLLHEYAHLLLHTNGLCDTTTDLQATTPERQLEARSNALAAAILMPAREVLNRPEVVARVNQQESWSYESLRGAAAPFGVSAEAFLRRLLTLGRVTTAFYQARRVESLRAYEDEERRTRISGGDWYRNTVRDLGKAMCDKWRTLAVGGSSTATPRPATSTSRLVRSTGSRSQPLCGKRCRDGLVFLRHQFDPAVQPPGLPTPRPTDHD